MSINLSMLAHRAMIERGLQPDFTEDIIQEVNSLQPMSPFIRSFNGIKDLRKWAWFSIDNEDSRDLDQLTYAEKRPNGEYTIYIAVANVEHLVKRFTAIDKHAETNTTSVYTPTQIFPMLPERLSTDLTSLNPNQDRLALIFEGVISEQGILKQYNVSMAYVHNHAQLVYDTVSEWLEQRGPMSDAVKKNSEIENQLTLQDSISQKLGAWRHQQGALTLDTIETRAVVKNGFAIALTETAKGRARELIENFMIVANTISALFSENRLPTLRRVVVEPKRWDKIVLLAKEKNFMLPDKPNPESLEHFLNEQKKKAPLTFPELSLTVIKLLGKGEYVISFPGKAAPGHFGLALKDYSHSTAPNRRFPDLITQRLLVAYLTKQKLPYTDHELLDLAARCTQKEDDAEKVERRMKKSAAAMVLSDSIGKTFAGVVTGASEKGTWVRIFSPPVEGKVIRGFHKLDVGDLVNVKLVSTNVEAGFIDFEKVNGQY